ncbi:MAG: hypothetical protein MUC68_02175 [Burkholderiaceae bacterium]|nr:hypothetical protein [Burkholderiaceae bacterium]
MAAQRAAQAVDHHQLPQRPAAVERGGVQARHAVIELRTRAGPRQRHALHVMVEIDLVAAQPRGVGEPQRHRQQAPRERLGQMQSRADQAPDLGGEVAVEAGRQREQAQAADMHRHLGRLELQEQRIEAAERLHIGRRGVLCEVRRDVGRGRCRSCSGRW